MSWAEDHALAVLMSYGPHGADLRVLVQEAIRETIEKCARAVEDAGGDNEEYHAEAIRKLGEP